MPFVLIQDSNVQPLEDQEMCAICQEDFNETPTETTDSTDATVTTICRHKFHEGCLVPWLENQSSCPTCRKEIAKFSLDEEFEKIEDLLAKGITHSLIGGAHLLSGLSSMGSSALKLGAYALRHLGVKTQEMQVRHERWKALLQILRTSFELADSTFEVGANILEEAHYIFESIPRSFQRSIPLDEVMEINRAVREMSEQYQNT